MNEYRLFTFGWVVVCLAVAALWTAFYPGPINSIGRIGGGFLFAVFAIVPPVKQHFIKNDRTPRQYLQLGGICFAVAMVFLSSALIENRLFSFAGMNVFLWFLVGIASLANYARVRHTV